MPLHSGLPRREFLRLAASAAAALTVSVSCGGNGGRRRPPTIDADAPDFFTCGVCSGDPTSDRVLLWTRIEPSLDPALIRVSSPYADAPEQRSVTIGSTTVEFDEWRKPAAGGGDPERFSTVYSIEDLVALDRGTTAEVFVEVRSRDDFDVEGSDSIVTQAFVETDARRDYTVKVDVAGLEPATEYFYRFVYGGRASEVGRAKTLPAEGAAADRLRFIALSCQSYWQGYWNAFHHVGRETDVDFILHLGDYIYEYGGDSSANGVRCDPIPPGSLGDPPKGGWAHEHRAVQTLSEYRAKYRYYRQEPTLRAAHLVAPMIATIDDHEVRDNHWGPGYRAASEPEGTEIISKAERIANALYVWFEYMPMRRFADDASSTRVHRTISMGELADLVVLDSRQYRTGPPFDPAGDAGSCGEDFNTRCAAYEDPERTYLGAEQRDWFVSELRASRDRGTAWRIVVNQTMVMPLRINTDLQGNPLGITVFITLDSWDGYPAERQAILDQIAGDGDSAGAVDDVVFLTGDIHIFVAGDCWRDFTALPLLGEPVATEYVVSSVSSAGLDDLVGQDGLLLPEKSVTPATLAPALVVNPYFRFANFDCHGYGVFEVTPDELRATYRAVRTIRAPDTTSPIETIATFRQARGTNRVELVSLTVPLPPLAGDFRSCP